VTTAPAGSTPSLQPAGLLASKSTSADEFEVDLKGLLTMPAPTASTSPLTITHDGVTNTALAKPAVDLSIGSWLRKLKPTALYVRVVPMADSQPLALVSNEVVFNLIWEDPNPVIPILKQGPGYIANVDFARPYLPNSDYTNCVRVVDNPFAGLGFGTGYNPYGGPLFPGPDAPNGSTHCPYWPSKGGLDLGDILSSAFSFVGEFWDAMVAAFDYIKSQAVNWIVDISGCKAFLSDSACTTIVRFAVDAALMYFGIPPSLPTAEEVIAAGKGELSAAVIAYGKSVGIDCGVLEEQCKQAVGKALDEIQKHVEEAVSDSAKAESQASGGVLKLHPAIKVIPEPRGRLQPAVFRVTFTRTNQPLATGCTAKASLYSTINGPWMSDGLYKREPDSGWPLFGLDTFELPDLPAWSTVSKLFVLHRPMVWRESGFEYDQWETHESHWFQLMRANQSGTANPQYTPTTLAASVSSVGNYHCFKPWSATWQPNQFGYQL
jgi:hypothetical protein